MAPKKKSALQLGTEAHERLDECDIHIGNAEDRIATLEERDGTWQHIDNPLAYCRGAYQRIEVLRHRVSALEHDECSGRTAQRLANLESGALHDHARLISLVPDFEAFKKSQKDLGIRLRGLEHDRNNRRGLPTHGDMCAKVRGLSADLTDEIDSRARLAKRFAILEDKVKASRELALREAVRYADAIDNVWGCLFVASYLTVGGFALYGVAMAVINLGLLN